jgi:hypothetical protein
MLDLERGSVLQERDSLSETDVKNCAEILLHTLNFVKVNYRVPVPFLGKVEGG